MNRLHVSSRGLTRLATSFLLCFGTISLAAAQTRTVYDDALAADFQDWSWATRDLQSTTEVATGSFSVSMEPDDWEGVYLRATSPLSIDTWGKLSFQIHGGGSGTQQLRVYLQMGSTFLAESVLAPPPANRWERRTVDFGALGVTGNFDGIIFQDNSGGDQPTVYLDAIELEAGSAPPPGAPVDVTVDASRDRRTIDPRIYGVNFGTAQQLTDVGWPVRRWGGNSTTRYNWKRDVHNTAFDYYFQNIVGNVADESLLPSGSAADRFVQETLAAGAEPLMTLPTIGWAPVDQRRKKWAYSQAKYGPQTGDECSLYAPNPPPWCSADAGDGRCDPAVNTTGFCSANGFIVGNDPSDTSQPVGPSWIGDWVRHLTSEFGTATQGGPRLYALDNEPMLWNSTHRDLVTRGLDYDGLWDRTVRYAQAIKSADPGAETLGPVVWGWCAYFTSAADTELPGSNCLDGPDRQAHGGMPLVEWTLDQTCKLERSTGFRALDYLDVHFYPQGGVAGVGPGESAEDPVTAARRLRSTRELWDPQHVSESWINQPVRLIPRLRDWIEDRCPGTKLALTEYRWGGDDGLSSALAQVEILAIFGREGVDLATRWVAPAEGSLVEDAFRLFLDYDGNGSQLTGTSVRAASSDDTAVSSWAIEGGASTFVVLVNKDTSQRPARVDLSRAGVVDDTLETYRLAGTGLSRVADRSASNGRLTIDLPARSATLLVAPSGGPLFDDGFEGGDLAPWTVIVDP